MLPKDEHMLGLLIKHFGGNLDRKEERRALMNLLLLSLFLLPAWGESLGNTQEVLPNLYDGPIFSSDISVDAFGCVHIVYDRDVVPDSLIPVADEIMYLYRTPYSDKWLGPINISKSQKQSTYPKVLTDKEGTPWVFWLEDKGDTIHDILKRTDYFWSRREDVGFTHPRSLFHASSSNSDLEDGVPFLDPLGRPCLIFPASVPPLKNDIWFTYFDSDFVEPILLPLRGSYLQPHFESDGSLYLAFTGSLFNGNGTNTIIYSILDPFNAQIKKGPKEIYSNGKNPAFELNLIVTQDAYYSIWDEDTTGDLFPDHILTARAQDGELWSLPYELTYMPGEWFELDAASDSSGCVHIIAAFISDEGISYILYFRFDPKSGWDTPQVLDSSSISEQVNEAPRIFVDGSGYVYGLWIRKITDYDSYKYRLVFTKFSCVNMSEEAGLKEASVTVSPTVFNTHLLIKAKEKGNLPIDVKIYDVSGRLLTTLRGLKQIDWDGSDGKGGNLPRGVYFLKVSHGGEDKLFNVLKAAKK